MPEGCARGQNERKRTGQIKLLDELNVSKKQLNIYHANGTRIGEGLDCLRRNKKYYVDKKMRLDDWIGYDESRET